MATRVTTKNNYSYSNTYLGIPSSVSGDKVLTAKDVNSYVRTTYSWNYSSTTSNLCLTEDKMAFTILPHNVGDICYYNGSFLAYIPYTSWESSLGTPVGVCVVPTKHAEVWGNGKARFCALYEVNGSGTALSSHKSITWGKTYSKVTGITSYVYGPVWSNVSGGSVSKKAGMLTDYSYLPVDVLTASTYAQNVYDTKTRYFSSPYAVGMYKGDNEDFNTDYITDFGSSYPNAFSDFTGKENTTIILKHYSSSAAAKGCNLYSTSGVSAGNWYLPAIGEMLYQEARKSIINAAITACGGLTISNDYRTWSSTQRDASYAWGVGGNGMMITGLKNYDAYVRPYVQLD